MHRISNKNCWHLVTIIWTLSLDWKVLWMVTFGKIFLLLVWKNACVIQACKVLIVMISNICTTTLNLTFVNLRLLLFHWKWNGLPSTTYKQFQESIARTFILHFNIFPPFLNSSYPARLLGPALLFFSKNFPSCTFIRTCTIIFC